MTTSLLKVRGLKIGATIYPPGEKARDIEIVHGVDFDVERGKVLGLIGESGAGKSTIGLASMAYGRGGVEITGGSVEVNAGERMVDVTHADARTLRDIRQNRVAMVFQAFGLLPWRTVRENVGFGLELAGLPAAERAVRVDRQLSLVGLSDWADRKVGELSGGMQQRGGLARAFATDAPSLLMDEPFSALDPLIRTRLQAPDGQSRRSRPHSHTPPTSVLLLLRPVASRGLSTRRDPRRRR